MRQPLGLNMATITISALHFVWDTPDSSAFQPDLDKEVAISLKMNRIDERMSRLGEQISKADRKIDK